MASMMGTRPRCRPPSSSATVTSASPTVGLTAGEGGTAVEGQPRGAGRLRAAIEPARRRGPAGRRVRRRDHAHRGDRPRLRPRHRPDHREDAHRQPRRRPAPRHQPRRLAKLRTVFSARGLVTAGNSSQTSDGAGALSWRARPLRKYDHTAGALRQFRQRMRRRPSWASARSRRHPRRAALCGPEAGRPGLDRTERGLRGPVARGHEHAAARPGQVNPDGRGDRAGPPAGRPRARSVPPPSCTRRAASSLARHGHDVRGQAVGRAPRAFSSGSELARVAIVFSCPRPPHGRCSPFWLEASAPNAAHRRRACKRRHCRSTVPTASRCATTPPQAGPRQRRHRRRDGRKWQAFYALRAVAGRAGHRRLDLRLPRQRRLTRRHVAARLRRRPVRLGARLRSGDRRRLGAAQPRLLPTSSATVWARSCRGCSRGPSRSMAC